MGEIVAVAGPVACKVDGQSNGTVHPNPQFTT
jgi:hypothetical protein